MAKSRQKKATGAAKISRTRQAHNLAMSPVAMCIRNAYLPAASLFLTLNSGIVFAGPEGGQVAAGQGNISTPNSTTTVINQQSHNLAIDWNSFNVNTNELVQFNQPSKTASALNRIHDSNPSQIFGSINANGNVLLVNPNGVFFKPGSSVNVNSLTASGLGISNGDFMNGKLNFNGVDGKDGIVVNQGVLKAATGGSINLVGKAVRNEGVILASAGQVNLVAGKQVTIDFDGDGLMQFAVDKEVLINAQSLDAAVSNTGEINADGGTVLLKGSAAKDVFSHVVNNEGMIKAGRIENKGGQIRLVGLGAGSSVLNTGTLNVSGTNVDGGTVQLQSTDTTIVAGNSVIDASSNDANGGSVQILGDKVGLFDNTIVNASGKTGGGEVLVGGDFQGKNPDIQNAFATYVGENVVISADAVSEGDGGKVIVWSDDTTRFHGTAIARGGSESGDGGLIETSGKKYLDIAGSWTDASAINGEAGTWLLDPTDVNIVAGLAQTDGSFTVGPPDVWAPNNPPTTSTIGDQDIEARLNVGTSVTITTDDGTASTGNGDVTQAGAATIDFTGGGGAATFRIDAAGTITLSGGITATTAALNVDLNANDNGGTQNDQNTATGDVIITASINTNGGSFDSSGVAFDNTGGTITTGNGSILLQHTGLVTVGADISATGFNPVSITGSDITVNSGASSIDVGASDIGLNAVSGTFTMSDGAEILGTGTIDIIADMISIGSDIGTNTQIGGTSTGAGNAAFVVITRSSAGSMGLAGGAGSLNLATLELEDIRSTDVRLGETANTGPIIVGGGAAWTPVATFATGVLTLASNAGITQGAGGINLSTSGSDLILRSAGAVTLTDGANEFGNVSATLSAGALQLTDVSALAITSLTDDIGTVAGITTVGGAVTLVAGGTGLTSSQDITTTAAVNTGSVSGAVNLDATGTGTIALAGNIITTGGTDDGTSGTAGAGGQVDINTVNGTIAVADITSSGGVGTGVNGGAAATINIDAGSATTTLNGSTLTAAGGTGTVQGAGANVTLSDSVVLATGAVLINTGATAGDILWTNTGGISDGNVDLTLTAGTGAVTIQTQLGTGGTALTSLTVTTTGTVTVDKIKTVNDISITGSTINLDPPGSGGDEYVSTAGSLTFTGAVNLIGAGSVTILSGGDVGDDITFNGTGTIDDPGNNSSLILNAAVGAGTVGNVTVNGNIGDANLLSSFSVIDTASAGAATITLADVKTVGSISITAATLTVLNGTSYFSDDGNITFAGAPVNLAAVGGTVTVDSDADNNATDGAIDFCVACTINNTNATTSLILDADTGDVLVGPIGTGTAIGTLTITGNDIDLFRSIEATDIIVTAKEATADGDSITIDQFDSGSVILDANGGNILFSTDNFIIGSATASLISTGGGGGTRVTFTGETDARTIGIGSNATAADLDLSEAELLTISGGANGFRKIIIGSGAQTGDITVDDAGGLVLTNPSPSLTLKAGGGTGNIIIDSAVDLSATTGAAVELIAGNTLTLSADITADTLTGSNAIVVVNTELGGSLADGLALSGASAAFTINTGTVADTVDINNATAGELTAAGETINYTTLGGITINTEGANDIVNINIVNVGNAFTLNGGASGGDILNIDQTGGTSARTVNIDHSGVIDVGNDNTVTNFTLPSSSGFGTTNTTGTVASTIDLTVTEVTAVNAAFALTVDGTQNLDISNGGTILGNIGGPIALSTLVGLQIDGGSGDDSLSVNYNNVHGTTDLDFTFNGGLDAGGGDSLTITNSGGGLFASSTYTHINATDGSVTLVDGFPNTSTINFTGLEPLTGTINSTTVTLNLPILTQNDDATFADHTTPSQIGITSASNDFEDTFFNVPTTTLNINLGDQGDTFIINGAGDSGFDAALNITGGTGADSLDVTGALSITSAITIVDVETVDVNALLTAGSLTAITGITSFDSDTFKITTTGASNVNGGNVSITTTGSIITEDIDALGGADGNNTGGNAGGNITLSAGTTLDVAAINTSGSNSVGLPNTGGNAGTIDLDGATSVTLIGDLTSAGGTGTNGTQGDGAIVAFDDPVILDNPGGMITIDTRGNTGGGVTFGGTLNATTAFDEDLRLRGGAITFTGITGGSAQLGSVIIMDSTDVSVDAAFTVETLTATSNITTFDSTGGAITTTGAADAVGGNVAVTTTGALTTGGINALGGTDTDGATSGGNDGGSVTLNAGTSTLSVGAIDSSGSTADASSAADGGAAGIIDLDADTSVTLGGNLTATGGNGEGVGNGGNGAALSFDDAVILGATVDLDTRGGTGTVPGTNAGITFLVGATIEATTAFTQGLTVRGGTIDFNDVVGGTNELGAVVITDSTQVDVDAAFSAASLMATSNITTFDSDTFTITTTGADNAIGGNVSITTTGSIITEDIIALGGTDADASGGNTGGNVTLNAGTTLRVGAVDSSGSDAAVASGLAGGGAGTIDLDGTTSVTLTNDLTATGGNGDGAGAGGSGTLVSFNDPVILNRTGNTVTIDTQAGTGGTGTGGGITFAAATATVDATTAFDEGLTLRGGAIDFNGVVGGTALGDVIITDSTQVDINNTFTAKSLTATTNITTFDSAGFAITTTGADEAVGGNVLISTSGNLTTDAITADGGTDADMTGGGLAGGVVTLRATDGTITTAAISTQGSDADTGVGVGGAGGAVTIEVLDADGAVSKNITVTTIDTSGGDSVGTNVAGKGGDVIIRVLDPGGTNGLGNVSLTSVDTRGGDDSAGTNGDGGAITLVANSDATPVAAEGTISTGTLNALSGVGAGTPGTDGAVIVTADGNLTLADVFTTTGATVGWGKADGGATFTLTGAVTGGASAGTGDDSYRLSGLFTGIVDGAAGTDDARNGAGAAFANNGDEGTTINFEDIAVDTFDCLTGTCTVSSTQGIYNSIGTLIGTGATYVWGGGVTVNDAGGGTITGSTGNDTLVVNAANSGTMNGDNFSGISTANLGLGDDIYESGNNSITVDGEGNTPIGDRVTAVGGGDVVGIANISNFEDVRIGTFDCGSGSCNIATSQTVGTNTFTTIDDYIGNSATYTYIATFLPLVDSGTGTINTAGTGALVTGNRSGTVGGATFSGIGTVNATTGNITLGNTNSMATLTGNMTLNTTAGGAITFNDSARTGLLAYTLNGGVLADGGTMGDMTITMSGAGGVVTLNAGGNAGTTFEVTGDTTFGGGLTLNNTPTIDVNANLTLGGGSLTATTGITTFDSDTFTITTTGENDEDGGDVLVTTSGLLTMGAIDALGGTETQADTAGNAGGTVTLISTANNVNVTGAIDASGSAGNDVADDNVGQVGGTGGNVTVTANAGTVSVGAITSSGGAADGIDPTENANGGDAGTINLDGTTSVTLTGNLTAVGGAGTTLGTGGAGTLVAFDTDPVILNRAGAVVDIDTRGGAGAATGTGGGVTFGGTVDATTAFDEDLSLHGGVVTFTGIAGATTLGDVIITDSTQVDIDNTFTAKSLTATTNITTFDSAGFAITTTGDTAMDGGVVSITTTGALTTAGITAQGGSVTDASGRAGSAVTLTGGTTTVTGTIDTSGSDGDDTATTTSRAGGTGGIVIINAGSTAAVGPIDASGGNADDQGGGANANGGAAGSVTITSNTDDSATTTDHITLNGTINALGGIGVNAGVNGANATVTLDAESATAGQGGSIIDGLATAALDVAAGSLDMEAAGNIGTTTAGQELDTDITNLSASSKGPGGIFINELDTATLDGLFVSGAFGNGSVTAGTTGDVELVSASTIRDAGLDAVTDVTGANITFIAPDGVGEATTPAVNGAVDTSLGAGTLTVNTSGGTGGIAVNNNGTLNTSQLNLTTNGATAQTVEISSTGFTVDAGDTDAGSSNLDANDTYRLTGPITLNEDINITGTSNVATLDLNGNVGFTAARAIDANNLIIGGNVSGGANDLTITSPTTNVAGSVTAGNINVTGNTTVGGTVNAGGSGTFTGSLSTGGAITTGTSLGVTGNLVSGGAITVGTTVTVGGTSNIAGGVTSTGNGTLTFTSAVSNINGDISGGTVTFGSTYNVAVPTIITTSTGTVNFNGNVTGAAGSVLAVDIPDGTALTVAAGTGANQINSTVFTGFNGHLILGGTITPLALPTTSATAIDISATSIDVNSTLSSGGSITLLAGQIGLNANVSAGGAGGATVNLTAVGDNGGALPGATGNIDSPAAVTVSAGDGSLVANGDITSPNNISLDFGGGIVEVATGAGGDISFAAGSTATSPQTTSTEFTSYLNLLGLTFTNFNTTVTTVSVLNPAADLIGLEELGFIDTGLFEQDLTLFGVIGQGIALALAQCEEIEGCAPDVTEEELNEFIAQIQARLEELHRRSSEAKGDAEREKLEELIVGYQAQLDDFIQYRKDLQEYQTAEEEDLGEEDLGEEDFGTEPDADAIKKLARMLETVNARIQWLESLKGDPEARARLSESTGIELTQEALDAIIDGAKSEGKFIEKQIKLLQEGTEAKIESRPLFIAEAGDHSLAQVVNYGPSLLNLGNEDVSWAGY